MMLILTRKKSERIILSHQALPGEIVIEHFALSGGRVKLGITAPKSVRIVRQELLDFPENESRPQPPRAA